MTLKSVRVLKGITVCKIKRNRLKKLGFECITSINPNCLNLI